MPASTATTNELLIKRVFDAPRQLVFDAWTKPEHLARWQGAPEGFTVSSHDVDLRPGGAYRLCMRSPEGVDHWLQGVYREVVDPERLVFTHVWLDDRKQPGPETVVTITLADLGGKTELTLHQTGFKAVQSRDGHYTGWTSTLDRFHAYIVSLSAEEELS
ncbi:MAG TPA: SRPBCC domain-containing protein [Bryobacteraceae bacterium]|nr:SRPBCC domain-containing protein [Bryobacteraceae bacterium]